MAISIKHSCSHADILKLTKLAGIAYLHSSDGFESTSWGGLDGVNQHKVPPHLDVENRMLFHVHLKLLNSRAGSLGWHPLSGRT